MQQCWSIKTISFVLRQKIMTGANCQSLTIFKFKVDIGLCLPPHINNLPVQVFFNLHPDIVDLNQVRSCVNYQEYMAGLVRYRVAPMRIFTRHSLPTFQYGSALRVNKVQRIRGRQMSYVQPQCCRGKQSRSRECE